VDSSQHRIVLSFFWQKYLQFNVTIKPLLLALATLSNMTQNLSLCAASPKVGKASWCGLSQRLIADGILVKKHLQVNAAIKPPILALATLVNPD
jgi:hypothetical protein